MKKPNANIEAAAQQALSRSFGWLDPKTQPPPTPNDKPAVWDLVLADMAERRRCLAPAKPYPSKDGLVGAYHAALDMVAFLRQAIEERDGK